MNRAKEDSDIVANFSTGYSRTTAGDVLPRPLICVPHPLINDVISLETGADVAIAYYVRETHAHTLSGRG